MNILKVLMIEKSVESNNSLTSIYVVKVKTRLCCFFADRIDWYEVEKNAGLHLELDFSAHVIFSIRNSFYGAKR